MSNRRKSILQTGLESPKEKGGRAKNSEAGVVENKIPNQPQEKSNVGGREHTKPINSLLGGILTKSGGSGEVVHHEYKGQIRETTLLAAEETLLQMMTTDKMALNEDVGELIRNFNKYIPLFTTYLNKEFRYVDEDFLYFYTENIIFFGNKTASLPVGAKLTDLLIQILIDIFGFNKLHEYVSKGVEMDTKTKMIYNQIIDKIGVIYCNSVLEFHQNRYMINDDLSLNARQQIEKLSGTIIVDGSIVSNRVVDILKTVHEQVGESFSMDTMDYTLPINITIQSIGRERKFTYSIKLDEIDYSREYYYERLCRYLDMTSDYQDTEEGEGQEGRNYEREMDTQPDNVEWEIQKNIDDFNKIGNNYNLQHNPSAGKATLIEVKELPDVDWMVRLREWIDYYKPKKVNSYRTPNKKLLYTGMILSSSSNVNQNMGKQGVTIYIDTSTSVDMEKVKRSVAVLQTILQTYKGKVDVKTFTTKVKPLDINLSSIKAKTMTLQLGGGTDIRKVLEDIENSKTREYINVILTDGEIDWGAVEGAVNKKYKMAFLLTKPKPSGELPKAKNIKIYEVV